MRRTNIRTVKLEQLEPGNDEATKERNANRFDYTRRSAITTLEDFIIEPFTAAAFEEAEREAAGRAGNLSIRRTFPDIQVRVNIEYSTITKYEAVLAHFQTVLSYWRAGQGPVISEGEVVYIPVATALDELARLKKDKSEDTTRKSLDILSNNGEKLSPADITELTVYLDSQRTRRVSPENAKVFHEAKSLAKKLNALRKEYEKTAMQQEGIPEDDLPEQVEIAYEFSNGTAARFLFFSRRVTEHGNIFNGLTHPYDQKITTATGDLVIAAEKAFAEPVTYKHGRTHIDIRTEVNPERPTLGRLVIDRQSGNTNQRSYKILRGHDGLYIATSDLEKELNTLRTLNTTKPTQIKIDFYAAKPS